MQVGSTRQEFSLYQIPHSGVEMVGYGDLGINVPASRLVVAKLGTAKVEEFMAIFSVKEGLYGASIENYSEVLGWNVADLKERFSKDPKKQANIKFDICNRLEEIYVRGTAFAPYFDNLFKSRAPGVDWANRLYRTMGCKELVEADPTFRRISKKGKCRFGMLRLASAYINTRVEVSKPSMKVVRFGIDFQGRQVVIVKPSNANQALYFWQIEMAIWKRLVALQKSGEDMTGILVPLEIYESENPKKSRVVFDRKDGDLIDFVSLPNICFKDRSRFFVQFSKGLDFIHRKLGLAHGDLKIENVIYKKNADGEYDFFILDWGFANKLGKATIKGLTGTMGYFPPEFKYDGEEQCIDREAWDSWNYGQMLLFVMDGRAQEFNMTQGDYDNKLKNVEVLKTADEQMRRFCAKPLPAENNVEGIARRTMLLDPEKRMKVREAVPKVLAICNPAKREAPAAAGTAKRAKSGIEKDPSPEG